VDWAGDALNTQGSEVPGTQVDAFAPVGSGISASKSCATTLLAINAGMFLKSGLAVFGQSVGPALQISVKSPPRSAILGTGRLKVCPGTMSLRHSCDQKKNVLFLSLL